MAYGFPEGSYFQFSAFSGFAAAKTITALSNANPTAATSTAHGYTTNDEVLLNSAWEDATDTIYRVTQTTADAFTIQGLNTTDTSLYPASGGVPATAQKITAGTWTSIPQVLTVATSGGDPKFTTIQPLARRTAINVPTGFNATSITLQIGDDPANATLQTMLGISRTLAKIGFKMVVPGQGTTYGFGYMSVGEVAQLATGQTNQRTVVLTLLGKAMTYSS